jgi:hypothetical protein
LFLGRIAERHSEQNGGMACIFLLFISGFYTHSTGSRFAARCTLGSDRMKSVLLSTLRPLRTVPSVAVTETRDCCHYQPTCPFASLIEITPTLANQFFIRRLRLPLLREKVESSARSTTAGGGEPPVCAPPPPLPVSCPVFPRCSPDALPSGVALNPGPCGSGYSAPLAPITFASTDCRFS